MQALASGVCSRFRFPIGFVEVAVAVAVAVAVVAAAVAVAVAVATAAVDSVADFT